MTRLSESNGFQLDDLRVSKLAGSDDEIADLLPPSSRSKRAKSSRSQNPGHPPSTTKDKGSSSKPDGQDRFNPFEDDDEEESKRGIFAGCKSWAVSTCLHLILIVLLAIFSTQVGENTRLSLIVGSDSTDLIESDDLLLDASRWEDELEMPVLQEETQQSELMQMDDLFNQQDHLRNALASTSIHPDGQNSSFFGIEAVGDRIVYVVDRSGSMWGERWSAARAELIRSIEQLNSNQEFHVFLFSKKCTPMPSFAGQGKMTPATKDNVAKAKEWLLKQQPDGHTYPLSSVRRALRLEPDTIYLLTDGNFEDGTGKFLIERALMADGTSRDSELVINTIAFQSDLGLEMLKQIAIANSGTFRHVD